MENAEKCFTSVRDYLLGSEGKARSILEPTDGGWISVSSIEPSDRRLGGFRSDVIYIKVDPYGPQYFYTLQPLIATIVGGLNVIVPNGNVSGRVILYIF